MADQNTQNFFDEFLAGIKDTTSEDSESFRRAFEEVEARAGRNPDASRFQKMLAENPTLQTLRDLIDPENPYGKERRAMGMGLDEKSTAKRAGQVTGRIIQDGVRDATRGAWWLINAPQAVADVVAESAIRKANPDIVEYQDVTDFEGKRVRVDAKDFTASAKAGATNRDGDRQKNVRIGDPQPDGTDKKGNPKSSRFYQRPNVAPGHVNALRAPTAIAINAGMGLMNYTGGQEGYTAAIPSQEDPTKTANVLAEIAAKYIVGRTGNLLPYDEFKQVRPDVSKEEYQRYKAFKYDKSIDLDPTDGNVNLLPLGILKATADGIHGPEVQFLGRSLGVNEVLLPTAAAMLGTAASVYGVKPDKGLLPDEAQKQLGRRIVRRGLIGGTAAMVGGMAAGNLLEAERRRRNQEENERDGSLYRS